MKKLSRDFFTRHSEIVAAELLGKTLEANNKRAIIIETECYRGYDDPASHAYRGPTKRSQTMFEEPGRLYVYLIYGMHHCLNFITEPKGNPGAVLIRAIKDLDNNQIINGPGRVCKYLNITREHNGADLLNSEFKLYDNQETLTYQTSPRIGIKQGLEKLWRFTI